MLRNVSVCEFSYINEKAVKCLPATSTKFSLLVYSDLEDYFKAHSLSYI